MVPRSEQMAFRTPVVVSHIHRSRGCGGVLREASRRDARRGRGTALGACVSSDSTGERHLESISLRGATTDGSWASAAGDALRQFSLALLTEILLGRIGLGGGRRKGRAG